MPRVALVGIGIGGIAALAVAAYAYQQHRKPSGAEQFALVDKYCEGCHNDAERAGELTFDRLDSSRMHADAAVWEKVIRKLRGGLMPPPGEPRPAAERLDAFVGFVEESLDSAARAEPNPGVPALRRLNRTEYANAVRDLIELPVDVEALLPGDDSVGGFDNIGSALSISPTLLQAYVSAAATLSRSHAEPLGRGRPERELDDHNLPCAARLAERQPHRRTTAWHARRLSGPAPVPSRCRVRDPHLRPH